MAQDSDPAGSILQEACQILPSPSGVALQILRLVQSGTASTADLADVISQDPALSARLLRIANSSLYGLSGRVRTVRQAAVALGQRQLKSLALSFVLVSTVSRGLPEHFDLAGFWTDSVIRAAGTRRIAEAARLPHCDVAFTAGLLCHIGVLAASVGRPDEYANVLDAMGEQRTGLEALEREHLGFTHAELGAALAEQWSLPTEIVLAIRHHESLDGFHADDSEVAGIVHAAYIGNLLARFFRSPDAATLSAATSFVADTWRMGEEVLDAALQGIRGLAAQCAIQLGILIKPVANYVEILEMAQRELAKQVCEGIEAGDESVRNLIGVCESLSARVERLEAANYRDEQTGAYNLRACRLFAERLFVSARGSGSPLGVVSFDVNDFKGVNMRIGRSAANEVLRKLVGLVQGLLHEPDRLCRCGGDEFAILLPGADHAIADALACRIRDVVAEHDFPVESRCARIAVTAGSAACDEQQQFPDPESLLQAADTAMYEARQTQAG